MPKKFKKWIIFSKSKLNCNYRFRDEFQIYPLDIPEAPEHSKADNIPCCLEFMFDPDDVRYWNPFGLAHFDKMVSETTAQLNRVNTILNLLSSISNHRFHVRSGTESIWSFPVDDIDDSKTESSLSLELYAYPKMGSYSNIDAFSTKPYNQCIFDSNKRYYWDDPIEKRSRLIALPLAIDKIFEKYFGLDENRRKVVDSAAYQICNAIDLRVSMKSLSFFSAISALETMIAFEYKGEKIEFECKECQTIKSSVRVCRKCGRPKWGIAEKFREFLLKHVSNTDDSRRLYNKLYSIRSKIAHTQYLLYNDGILDWDSNDKTDEIFRNHLNAIQLSRQALANWILSF